MNKIEITTQRGEIPIINYDREFFKKIDNFMMAENKSWKDSLYKKLRLAHSDLVDTVSKIAELDDESFTIVLKVEGGKKKYPSGPVLY